MIGRRLLVHKEGLRELAIFAAAYLVYFGVRAITEGTARDGAAATRGRSCGSSSGSASPGSGRCRTAVVGSRLLLDAANAVYIYGHWPVIIVAGVLLFRLPAGSTTTGCATPACSSGLVGLVIFALFPVAPPRLTDLPLVDTVTRHAEGYRQIVPPSLVNEYAAMPSFHAGWNVLLGHRRLPGHAALAAARVSRSLVPAAMVVAVVATANHFVVDVVAGVADRARRLLVVHDARGSRRTLRSCAMSIDADGPPAVRSSSRTVPATTSRACAPREALGIPLVEADVHLFAGRLEVRHLKTRRPAARPVGPLGARAAVGAAAAARRLLASRGPGTELMLDLKGRDRAAARAGGSRRSPSSGRGAPVTVCAQDWRLLEPLAGRAGRPPRALRRQRAPARAAAPALAASGSRASRSTAGCSTPASVRRAARRADAASCRGRSRPRAGARGSSRWGVQGSSAAASSSSPPALRHRAAGA